MGVTRFLQRIFPRGADFGPFLTLRYRTNGLNGPWLSAGGSLADDRLERMPASPDRAGISGGLRFRGSILAASAVPVRKSGTFPLGNG